MPSHKEWRAASSRRIWPVNPMVRTKSPLRKQMLLHPAGPAHRPTRFFCKERSDKVCRSQGREDRVALPTWVSGRKAWLRVRREVREDPEDWVGRLLDFKPAEPRVQAGEEAEEEAEEEAGEAGAADQVAEVFSCFEEEAVGRAARREEEVASSAKQ